jgi:hypothetical protein
LSAIFPFLNPSQKETSGRSQPILKPRQKETASLPPPYRLRDDFLSPAEFPFYKVLSSLVGASLTIESKVRLADVCFVARPYENFAYFNRITRKHLDFLAKMFAKSPVYLCCVKPDIS